MLLADNVAINSSLTLRNGDEEEVAVINRAAFDAQKQTIGFYLDFAFSSSINLFFFKDASFLKSPLVTFFLFFDGQLHEGARGI